MHLKAHSIFALLVAASTSASPLPGLPTNTPRPLESFTGENGYYYVVTAPDGTHSATFTPISPLSLNLTSLVERSASVTYKKRASPLLTTCQGLFLNPDDVLGAQAGLRLASDSNPTTGFPTSHWAFVRVNSVIAYACSYQIGVYYMGDDVNDFELMIDNACGWPYSGYTTINRNPDGNYCIEVPALAIGRDAYGRDICTSGFTGW